MRVASLAAGVRRWTDRLTDRERRMLGLLGAVMAASVVLLPVLWLQGAVDDLRREGEQMRQVLRELRRSRARLVRRQAELRALQERYRRRAPPLGSFVEAKAREHGLRITEVADQPDKELDGYRRRHTRVTLPNVDIAAFVRMVAAIKNSPYPVAIERIQIDHYGERFNAQLGVYAYDAPGRAERRRGKREARPQGGKAGPPPPP